MREKRRGWFHLSYGRVGFTRENKQQAVIAVLEYQESRCELDTWQERFGHERATTPGVGRKFYHWQCTDTRLNKT